MEAEYIHGIMWCDQYEGAFSGMPFVAFRGHNIETGSLHICLSRRDYLWEHAQLLSLNLLCKPDYSDRQAFCEALETYIYHTGYLLEYMETN